MIEYLSKVFGESVSSSEYKLPGSAPFYLTAGYKTEKLTLGDSRCILITPFDAETRLPVLKNHYRKICEITDLPCALNLEKLTSLQRENLISEKIPFISGLQIYLPFWGSVFTARMKAPREASKFMTAATQLVFLHVFYSLSAGKNMNAAIVSTGLGIPKSTAAKAVQDLAEYGLFNAGAEGTNKWLSFNGSSADVIKKAMPLMRSPIRKTIWLKEVPEGISYMLGGIRALAEKSMLACGERDGAVVYNSENAKLIPKELHISRRDFDDFGGTEAEIWRYNPELLSSGKIVDELSLLVCLKDCEDERVQKELDTIRYRYGLEEGEI